MVVILKKNCENSIVQFSRILSLEKSFRFFQFFSCAVFLSHVSPQKNPLNVHPKDSARDW